VLTTIEKKRFHKADAMDERSEETGSEFLEQKSEPVWNLVRLDGIKILLVEDTPDARVYISRIFHRAGAEVLSAASAQEARQILLHEEPDVIVSDIAMPDEDGLSFIRKLRSNGGRTGARIPAMALTAFTDSQTRNQIFKAGFQAHVAKCSDFEAMLRTVCDLAKGEHNGTLH
jgi:CheY-like chemotaxis protein